MRLLVTRPEPDASEQGQKLGQLGLSALIEPLMEIEFLDVEGLDEAVLAAQALIATSRNGLRALARLPVIGQALHTPVLAVGPATARLASEMGFDEVHEGGGRAQDLLALAGAACQPARGPLLHLAGEELAFDLRGGVEAQGFVVIQPVLYRATAKSELSVAAKNELESGTLAGVILMSPRTAKTYARLIAEADLEEAIGPVMHFCLSEAVAEQLSGDPEPRYLVAKRPREDDLLALIAKHAADCQSAAQKVSR